MSTIKRRVVYFIKTKLAGTKFQNNEEYSKSVAKPHINLTV